MSAAGTMRVPSAKGIETTNNIPIIRIQVITVANFPTTTTQNNQATTIIIRLRTTQLILIKTRHITRMRMIAISAFRILWTMAVVCLYYMGKTYNILFQTDASSHLARIQRRPSASSMDLISTIHARLMITEESISVMIIIINPNSNNSTNCL